MSSDFVDVMKSGVVKIKGKRLGVTVIIIVINIVIIIRVFRMHTSHFHPIR